MKVLNKNSSITIRINIDNDMIEAVIWDHLHHKMGHTAPQVSADLKDSMDITLRDFLEVAGYETM